MAVWRAWAETALTARLAELVAPPLSTHAILFEGMGFFFFSSWTSLVECCGALRNSQHAS